MTDKQAARERTALLKRLRETHAATVAQTRDLLKQQKDVRRRICQTTRDAPKTVPEIAQLTGLPASEVLWHITAMRKYGLVMESGMCEEYYLYQRVEGAKS